FKPIAIGKESWTRFGHSCTMSRKGLNVLTGTLEFCPIQPAQIGKLVIGHRSHSVLFRSQQKTYDFSSTATPN
ncbi:MAG TPA: hypothetical protein VGW77_12115, partial [Candidatus Binatia bacterium]|nr:hypothetical protein [Candidatus Binatia bacterium]